MNITGLKRSKRKISQMLQRGPDVIGHEYYGSKIEERLLAARNNCARQIKNIREERVKR